MFYAKKHEQYVTSLINNIYAAADAAKDYRTMQFLDWFVKEQGEEEKNADDMIKKYELYLNPYRDGDKPVADFDEEAVVTAYKKYLGEDAEITVIYVDDLPIQQSGKTMVCENHCEAYL